MLDFLEDILTSGCHFHRSILDMQWRNKSNEHTRGPKVAALRLMKTFNADGNRQFEADWGSKEVTKILTHKRVHKIQINNLNCIHTQPNAATVKPVRSFWQ